MNTPLDVQLQELRRASEEREAQRRAHVVGLPYIDLSKAPVELSALALIPEADARRARVASIQQNGMRVLAVVFDPKFLGTSEIIERLQAAQFVVHLEVCSLTGLEHVWSFYARAPHETAEITGVVAVGSSATAGTQPIALPDLGARLAAYDFKTIKTPEILNDILWGALAHRASDIHFEPAEHAIRVRYRIDGLLHDVTTKFSSQLYKGLLSRIKLLAELKLNVVREPQDGRFTIKVSSGKAVEIRVSTLPSEFGETIVLRVLYTEAIELDLPTLGLRADDLAIVQQELQKPDGMILNTGPTGSGKTTTLYAFLRMKRTPEVKIVTIEHPIEYHLEGIEQTQVDVKSGYDFATALKSILRQDPDVILVGEINDRDTAEVGMQAALTGHLVFSTVHANSAPAAIPRLLDLGISLSTIGPAVNLVIAQRLVRRLCAACRVPRPLHPTLAKSITEFLASLSARVTRPALNDVQLYSAKGCPACNGFGYKGRMGIFEIFRVDDAVETGLQMDTSLVGINKLARAQGMVPLQHDGLLKALRGETTLDELVSVTGPIEGFTGLQ